MTRAQITANLGCCSATTHRLIKELRRDHEPIIPIIGKDGGLKYLPTPEDCEQANELLTTQNWLTSMTMGIARLSDVSKKQLKQAYKMAKNTLTIDERKHLRNNFLKLKQLQDIIELDEELEGA